VPQPAAAECEVLTPPRLGQRAAEGVLVDVCAVATVSIVVNKTVVGVIATAAVMTVSEVGVRSSSSSRGVDSVVVGVAHG
jgi:hypothetical protein